ncbi:Shikimate dehydrogenase (NADP(+)) [bioreactor metagenome]|uniref:Shikimate dehydrogenase (NADP(+)) n=1 Tax=bioreactor metagenome TaxID=1076179 RepID=A0A644XPY8_9ZZZZ
MAEKIYGLLGRSLKHSYSVPIHKALGNAAYRLIELEPNELEAFLRREDIGGLNVTIPYKRDVMPYCGVISPEAEEIGSVNTIARRADGRLCAWNTDAYGFAYLARRAGIDFSGRKTVILGSGGASRAVQAAARQLGASQVTVISRSGKDNYENLSRHRDAEIVVNATPVGMYPGTGASPVDLREFPACVGLIDLVYNPHRTALLMQAEALGICHSGGLAMLVAQAKAAEEYFFGIPIPDTENERIFRQIRRQTENIVLVGMPGCGKSTVGAALAKLTGREAVDIDAEIVKAAGRSIQEIFTQCGEEEFRRLEREETAKVGRESGKIIVTGGGVVKDERNYPSLRQNGRIYHLTRDLTRLAREGRPLSKGADLAALYRERLPMYTRFRDTVIDNNGTARKAAEEVWREFCENTGD